MRSRRSCLSVPGSQPRYHEKADGSAADEVLLDLEDSVAPAAKVRARQAVVEALRNYEYRDKVRSVRVNACDTAWCFEDVIAVVEGAGSRIDCLVVPKVEDVAEVHFVAQLLSQLESKLGLEKRIGLELQIESARGLENVSAIAGCSERCEALVLGPGDLAASLQMPVLSIGAGLPGYPGEPWHYFRARILVAARAHGLQAIDGPYGIVRDLPGLRETASLSAILGFDGKWALNPAQVEVLNEVFAPRQEDFDRAAAVLDVHRGASDLDQRGAVMLGDEMIDEASRKLAAVMVERGRALGMRARPWRPGG